jgi:23S rRNA (uridine2552-2'-O)-methyltransferase
MPRVYQPKDKYFYQAKKQGYRARSAFKLLQIQKKYGVIKKGMRVLDLGAAPGSWLQVTREIIGANGRLAGIDIEKIEPIVPEIITFEADLYSQETIKIIESLNWGKFNLILSDAAPSTAGVKEVDQARSLELSLRVVEIAEDFLQNDGNLVFKIFQSNDLPMLVEKLNNFFKVVKIFKPQASRDRSFELYVVAKGKY